MKNKTKSKTQRAQRRYAFKMALGRRKIYGPWLGYFRSRIGDIGVVSVLFLAVCKPITLGFALVGQGIVYAI